MQPPPEEEEEPPAEAAAAADGAAPGAPPPLARLAAPQAAAPRPAKRPRRSPAPRAQPTPEADECWVQCHLCDRWRSHPPTMAGMLRLGSVRFTCETANIWDSEVTDCDSAGDWDDLHSRPAPADADGGEEESDEPGSATAQLAATHDHDLIVTFTAARVLYCGYTPVVEQRLKFLGSVVKPDLYTLGSGMVYEIKNYLRPSERRHGKGQLADDYLPALQFTYGQSWSWDGMLIAFNVPRAFEGMQLYNELRLCR